MWGILRHKTNSQGSFAGGKSEIFSKGSVHHTACLGEGLHGEPRFPFPRPISRGRSCRGPDWGPPGLQWKYGVSSRGPRPPAHRPRRRNPFSSLSWRGLEVSLFVGLTADWNNKGNGSPRSFTDGLNTTTGLEIQELWPKCCFVFHLPKWIWPMPWVANGTALGTACVVIRLGGLDWSFYGTTILAAILWLHHTSWGLPG